MWLGPAPVRPFNQNRFHGSWRHFWDYGSGMASDWGVHLMDIALWAKDDLKGPSRILVYAENTYPEKRARETFDSMNICIPKEGYSINFDVTAGIQRGPWDMLYGMAFVGDDATIVIDRNKLILYPEYDNENKKFKTEEYKYTEGKESHNEHVRNFIDCVKSRNQPVCPPEIGRASALHMHMANIAGRVREPILDWDEAGNRFSNSEEANKLIRPVYRSPWTLPVIS
jgi:predicted dehydrogenase